jgi:hypothetical protein
MGRELFDYAFKMYSNRWMFKHPNPEDLFRTLEDASSVDLDWFWRGWFYTTDHVDIDLKEVKYFMVNDENIEKIKEERRNAFEDIRKRDISNQRNQDIITYRENDKKLDDFYSSYDQFKVTKQDLKKQQTFNQSLSNDEKNTINNKKHYYEIQLSNKGGLVMPVILDFTFENNKHQIFRIPAEIWKRDNFKIQKLFAFDSKVVQIELDPFLETADTDRSNNYWPVQIEPTKFELYRYKDRHKYDDPNPMKKKKK